MKGRLLFFAGIIIVLSACSANRALPEEKVLFPSVEMGKWWLLNVVSTDGEGKDVHLSALLSFNPVSGKYYTSFFTSLWMASDSVYYSGIQSADDAFFKTKLKFPILLDILGKDSTHSEWSWSLGRKAMRLNSVLKDKESGESLPISMNIQLDDSRPFKLIQTMASPEIQSMTPSVSGNHESPFVMTTIPFGLLDMKLKGTWKMKAPANLSVHVMSSEGQLLIKTKKNYISWLDLNLKNGKHLSALLETDALGNIQVLSQTLWDAQGKLTPSVFLVKIDKSAIWKSSVTHKSYPLGVFIQILDENVHLSIRPRIKEQEISANKNSFWMGAIEAKDSVTGAVVGVGNMYILKQ